MVTRQLNSFASEMASASHWHLADGRGLLASMSGPRKAEAAPQQGIRVLGRPPKRIDVLTTPSGVTFDECWPDRLMVTIDQLQIPVLGLQSLIDNKLAAGRDQDLVDVAALRRVLRRKRP